MDYLNLPVTAMDFHLWQALGLVVGLIYGGFCLSANHQAIRETQAAQKALFCKQRELELQDKGHAGTLGPLPLAFERPMSPARRRKARIRRFKATLARLILPLLGQPIVPPLQTTFHEGRRRP